MTSLIFLINTHPHDCKYLVLSHLSMSQLFLDSDCAVLQRRCPRLGSRRFTLIVHANNERKSDRKHEKQSSRILLSLNNLKKIYPVPLGLALMQESGSSSESDSSFDLDEALLKDPNAMIEEFAADWVVSLPRDDLYALSLLLFHILQQEFQQLIYPASEIIGRVLNKNYKTTQKWRVGFIHNEGEVPEFVRGKYNRMQAISNNEDLTEQAKLYVRENSFKKGAPNMTIRSFCFWVNNKLLPNSTLEPEAPRKISPLR